MSIFKKKPSPKGAIALSKLARMLFLKRFTST